MMTQTPYFQQEHATHTIARYHREAKIARALHAVGHEPWLLGARRSPMLLLTLALRP